MRRTQTLTLIVCLAAPFYAAAGTPDCASINDAQRTRLLSFVQKKYNLASVDVQEMAFIDGSCYRKLRFTSTGAGRPFRMELIASPDLRFLTRELIDSNADPEAEAKREARAVAESVTKGNPASLGDKGAPVTMVLFSDFQCPFCSQMANGLMRDILPSDGDKIHLIFRQFPLAMHPWARAAAEATACARRQGDKYFWTLHDYIFSHQREISLDNMVDKLSEQADFDKDEFKTCVGNKETVHEIDQDVALGNDLKVTGTPTLFINGQRVSGYRAEQIRTLLREQAP